VRPTPLLVLLLLGACGSPDTSTEDMCDVNGQCPAGFECNLVDRRCYRATSVPDAPLPDAPEPDAALPDAEVPDAMAGCPQPTGGPTMHSFATVSADETWTANGSPHIIEGDLRIAETAVLTLEPCAEVQLAANASVSVGFNGGAGRLVAEGTADRPIRFVAGAAQPWANLHVRHPATASLAHAVFEGGGEDRFQGYATIVATGDRLPGVRPMLKVVNVEVRGSRGWGLRLTDSAGFAPGSTGLVVTGSGANPLAAAHALAIGMQAAGTIPDGTYTGNRPDAILLERDVIVTEDLTVRDLGVPYDTSVSSALRVTGATVTLAAGVTVRMYPGTAWVVGATPATGGRLVAEGTAEKKVRFTGLTEERWANLTAQHPGSVSLTHTILEGGGEDRFRSFATLVAWGDNVPPVKPVLEVKQVTILRSKGAGAVADRFGGFAPGSTDLTIAESGGDEFGYPLRVATPAVGTIPPGSYGGNRAAGILLDTREINDSDAFHDRGLPYVLPFALEVSPLAADRIATLTIDPGVTLRFGQNAYLVIGVGSSASSPFVGQLIAAGTAEKPIVFTADSATPARGFWRGIAFAGIAPTGNRIEHAVIEYAGADCLCSGFGCAPDEDAGVIFYNYRPDEAFIRNTTFRHIDGHGVTSGWRSDLEGPDFKPTNTFEDLAGCQQVRWRPVAGSCPADPCY
jgi:hypothetical protein